MSQTKNTRQFAEIEYCIQRYFEGSLSPVMKQVKDDLSRKQTKELADYQRSPAGIMSSANPYSMLDLTFGNLKAVGKWNSKTTEDYVAMCNTQIQNNPKIQKDLAVLAEEWRSAVVKQIGRARYDELSKKIGCDMAYAYLGSRMEDLMVDKLVKDNMPQSTADYILRKAAQTSIWGISNELMKSPLTREVEERGEKAYNPSGTEKFAGKALGSAADAVSMGGAGSWKALASFVGSDLAISYIIDSKKGSGQQRKELAMETAISKGVFGSKTNMFTGFRKQAGNLDAYNDSYIKGVNKKLSHKIVILDPKYSLSTLMKNKPTLPQFDFMSNTDKRNNPKYKNVPLCIAPGKEDDYLRDKAKLETQKKESTENTNKPMANQETQIETPQENTATEQPAQTNSDGWGNFLSQIGFGGIDGTFKNLGYSLAMLPDVLVGMFTGRTKSLNLKNTMIPLAAVFAGLFVKNPILKTLLIGLGGLNLVNRGAQEALSWQKEEEEANNTKNVTYRQYADEPLNPRIVNPILQGNNLVATIDNVPCTIQLTDNVANAYRAGALPLNTLANAILQKNDSMKQYAQTETEEYRQLAERHYGEQDNETVHRTRGIQ